MGEHDGILANIGYYEDLLRASPQDPRRPIIERLLAKEHERLRERASTEPCALLLEGPALSDGVAEGEDRAQRVNNADPTPPAVYGSLLGFFTHFPRSPLKTPIKVSH